MFYCKKDKPTVMFHKNKLIRAIYDGDTPIVTQKFVNADKLGYTLKNVERKEQSQDPALYLFNGTASSNATLTINNVCEYLSLRGYYSNTWGSTKKSPYTSAILLYNIYIVEVGTHNTLFRIDLYFVSQNEHKVDPLYRCQIYDSTDNLLATIQGKSPFGLYPLRIGYENGNIFIVKLNSFSTDSSFKWSTTIPQKPLFKVRIRDYLSSQIPASSTVPLNQLRLGIENGVKIIDYKIDE